MINFPCAKPEPSSKDEPVTWIQNTTDLYVHHVRDFYAKESPSQSLKIVFLDFNVYRTKNNLVLTCINFTIFIFPSSDKQIMYISNIAIRSN